MKVRSPSGTYKHRQTQAAGGRRNRIQPGQIRNIEMADGNSLSVRLHRKITKIAHSGMSFTMFGIIETTRLGNSLVMTRRFLHPALTITMAGGQEGS